MIKSLPIALLAVAGTFVSSSFADIEDTISKTFDIGMTGKIQLSNINGDVSISSCDCATVSVEATIKAPDQEARDRIKIEMDHSGDRLEITTEYEKRNSKKNSGTEVSYQLMIPASSNLEDISLVNGDLTIAGIKGQVETNLVNGKFNAQSLASSIKANLVNGSMDVNYDSLSGVESIELSSVNGKVELLLPSNAEADIDASTVNGKISNDFGISVIKNKYVGSSMSGTLGNGSVNIDIETVNGRIKVNRR
ncbi:DUF4097 family beta strand repeat-containing protein [Pleionea sediminis]|uniref:DUF4097 family beta strand repeat-containing protein n=1 Tax=Pleionea sediminis TaxID=2569479 RepID=UPI0011865695|nr:DUF4097 family beta strand repeat-containing protein [Pleionea sediminis]